MSQFPSLFLSHGSPMLALQDSPARRFLQGLGKSLERPQAIVVVSAHWETRGDAAVSLAAQPETIHDFGGFPRALFEIEYPAPGAPWAAERVAALLEANGHAIGRSANRGLDHGAWVPLSLMYPEADIPVTQLSIVQDAGPAEHERIGRALATLRGEGVLVVASGALTHNLHELGREGIDAPVPHWVGEFGAWHPSTRSHRASDVPSRMLTGSRRGFRRGEACLKAQTHCGAGTRSISRPPS